MAGKRIAGLTETQQRQNGATWSLHIILTTLLQDELYAVNPALKAYRPEDEPQSVDQMVARLLSDALTLFAQCGRQEALAPIDALVQRVVTQV